MICAIIILGEELWQKEKRKIVQRKKNQRE